MENVNVVIVDDNPMILNTLDEMISSEAGLSVIGRADNGKDAIDMIKDTEPDVVLLDLVMPRVDGITVVENIKKKTSMFKNPVFRRSTRKFPSFSSCHFFISFPASRFFLYLQQIFNALLGLFLLKKFF